MRLTETKLRFEERFVSFRYSDWYRVRANSATFEIQLIGNYWFYQIVSLAFVSPISNKKILILSKILHISRVISNYVLALDGPVVDGPQKLWLPATTSSLIANILIQNGYRVLSKLFSQAEPHH